LHKKRAEEYTKTEATELKELDDKHSWKKERKNSVYHKNNDTSCSGMQSLKNSTTQKKTKTTDPDV